MKTELTCLDLISWCGFIMFATSAVIVPLCLPEISRSLDTSFSQGGAMETFRTMIVLLVLLLAAVWSRRWGKKPYLILGQYLLSAGMLLTSFATTYPILILSLMICGIGGGFSEALLNPLVADLHPRNTGKYLNLTNSFFSIGVLLASLIFGELLTMGFSWRWIFRLAATGALLTGLLFQLQTFPPQESSDHSSRRIISSILKLPAFWLYAVAIFLGGGVESAFTFWSRSYVDTYLASVPRAGSFAVVLFAGAMALGRLFSARLTRRFSLMSLMLFSACLGILVSLLIPLAVNLVLFYVLIALAGFATACLWPSILADAAATLARHGTMLFVMLATVGACGFGAVPLVMGLMGDTTGLRSGFYVAPGMFLCLLGILCLRRALGRTASKKNRPL